MSEETLARRVVTELQRQGFETYEEVSTGYGAKRADIVAVRGPILMVVECKAKASMRLLDQLTAWSNGAHLILGAALWTRHSVAAERYCRHEGFGLWSVNADEIHERVPPRLNRRARVESLRRTLRPEHRSAEYAKAGSQGGYWTPFRQTCQDLLEVVRKNPGIELREALARITHHYASPRSAMSSIPDLIRRDVIPGLRVEGVPLRVYPAAPAKAEEQGAA